MLRTAAAESRFDVQPRPRVTAAREGGRCKGGLSAYQPHEWIYTYVDKAIAGCISDLVEMSWNFTEPKPTKTSPRKAKEKAIE